MAKTTCLSRGPAREKKNNELLQCLFLTVVDYTRWTSPLLTHPKCISGRWIGPTCSVRGDTVSQTNVLSLARINVIYLPELGGQLPPLNPRPVRLCWQSCHDHCCVTAKRRCKSQFPPDTEVELNDPATLSCDNILCTHKRFGSRVLDQRFRLHGLSLQTARVCY